MIKLITDKYNKKQDESEEEWLLKIIPFLDLDIDFGTLDDCKKWVDSVDILEIDTETVKNFNDFSGHVFTFQVGNYDVQWVIDCTIESNHELCKYILRTDKLKLLQNSKYDIKWFLKWGINPTNIYDTMLAEVVLNTGYRIKEVGTSLDKLGIRYLNKDISKVIRGQINYLGLTPAVVEYAAGDVKYLSIIREKQLLRIEDAELQEVVNLENGAVRVFAEIEFNGLYLDSVEWLEVNKEYVKELIKFQKVLNDYVINHPVKKYYPTTIDMFEGEKLASFNFNSTQQMCLLLQRVGEIKNIKALKDIESMSEKQIELISHLEPMIQLYLDFKKMKTNISKYGEEFLKAVNKETNRVHTEFWQILNTGRVSSGRKDDPTCPNMQNIPKYKPEFEKGFTKHRGCFKAKDGFVFISLDYSSQELVLIAEDSQEPVWLEALKNGWDLHSYTAEMVFGETWTKGALDNCKYVATKEKCKCPKHAALRDMTKTINYGLAYGAGPNKLASIMKISVDKAKEIISMYFTKMSRLNLLFNTLANYGSEKLMIRTFRPFRRIRHFEAPVDEKTYHEIRRQSMNTRFQGTGADMVKLAMVKLYEELKPKYGNDCLFVLQVHDQVILEVREDLGEEIRDSAIRIMKNASKVILKTMEVGVDGDISKIWKH